MSDSEQRMAGLSPVKSQLLRLLLQERKAAARPAPIRPRARQSNDAPLTYSQERIWRAEQRANQDPWNRTFALRVKGPLQPALLEQSLNDAVRRHESLRTHVALVDDTPLQFIHPELRVTVPLLDLRLLSAGEREGEVVRLAGEEMSRRFDLHQAPLLRAKLLRLDEEEHVALLTINHLVTDGWSNTLLLQELMLTYSALARGLPAPLGPPPIQYADYACWQQQWLSGDEAGSQVEYWRRQLSGARPVELPTDYPRPPAGQVFPLASRSLPLEGHLFDACKALSRTEGVTSFMLFMAAILVTLRHYTGQEDLCLGTYTANRGRAETERVIGDFANTLTLRTRLDGDPTFRECLRRVRDVCLGAQANQDVPFFKLLEEIEPGRDPGAPLPLHRVLCLKGVDRPAAAEARGGGAAAAGSSDSPALSLHPVEFGHDEEAMHDFIFRFAEEPTRMELKLEYDTALFAPSTIHGVLDYIQDFLGRAVASPAQPLSALSAPPRRPFDPPTAR